MKVLTIYISGPISGLPDGNRPAFAEMAADMAFEFRALEALMESIVRLLDAECHTLSRRVTRTLDRLSRRAGLQ